MRWRVLVMAAVAGGLAAGGTRGAVPVETRLAGGSASQAATAPATRKAVDRSTPRAAMAAYFAAWRGIKLSDVGDVIVIRDPKMKQYADIVLNWLAWTRYLERAAVKKFGREGALSITGNQRTADEQLDIDEKRLPEASINYSADRRSATVFLQVEPGRPDGLQTDRFSFLDRYELVWGADGWRVDFLKTYDCDDADKEALYRFEAGVYPLLATAMKELADKLAAGGFATAAELKAELDARTEASYTGKPTGKTATRPGAKAAK